MAMSATGWMMQPLRRFADFAGRARRSEYWWFSLFIIIANIVVAILDATLFGAAMLQSFGGIGPLGGLLGLALLVPSLAVSVRRLHDLDKSGWFLLVGLIPLLGGLLLIYWFIQRGTVGANRFGADPVID